MSDSTKPFGTAIKRLPNLRLVDPKPDWDLEKRNSRVLKTLKVSFERFTRWSRLLEATQLNNIQIRVGLALVADGGARTVPGIDPRFRRERNEMSAQSLQQGRAGAAW